ncbi:MAG TPA: hypothetical protein VNW97_00230 [Candidatus Saccharimonadales bacterium]|jgi:hypothetical protein|nr:hypothetical protein [Candidatus Saccharimonadales bacterium]
MPADHEIKIALATIQGERQAVPQLPKPGSMNVGETVHYSSDDGEVRVEFPKETPFDTDVVINSDVKKLIKKGTFHCGCSITLKDGTSIGWHSGEPLGGPSGGVHDVGPH